ncbi:DUF3313 domain-containing protein [Inquilinus limosus]|uniref:DUF3313 domain-containing protein n=1 Tax=Inquilinus limosus TaxID=171674 RepID=A0A211ZE07_9PROT|nr:DUF3313 domain-containing protein [Inquilinus limosus]OWJ63532.1 hypothetical protein BWR60_29275 [Inquilinus limosus]
MNRSIPLPRPARGLTGLSLAAIALALAGCGNAAPVAYSGIASSAQLAPNPQDDTGHIPFRYATPVDWRSYNRIIVDPIVVYRGADNQFGDMSEADKAELAHAMQMAFVEKLKTRFALAADPAPGTLRLRLTLTGAATSTPVLSTFTRIDIGGGLYNGVQAVRGGEGLFTGSVIYAAEIYDAPTNRLLNAFVAKQYPGSMNIGATFGSLDAAKTGLEKGADALVAQLQ